MTDEHRWYLVTRKRTEGFIASAFRKLRQEGIEPILIKGWAAARNYPDGQTRFLGDIDLAVRADVYDKSVRLVYDQADPITGVDLHRELRTLDTLDWETLFTRSHLVPLENEDIRILAPEDHLRVMCVHWLIDGGESKDRLWDIYYAVENRPADFDWSKCLDVTPAHRRGWIIATIGLAHRYLGLGIDDLPFAADAKHLPRWLTRCVERGWRSDVPMQPLQNTLGDADSLLREVKKRLPPNPIQATVDCEGVFDDRSRIPYQARDFFIRIRPAIPRVIKNIFSRMRRRPVVDTSR